LAIKEKRATKEFHTLNGIIETAIRGAGYLWHFSTINIKEEGLLPESTQKKICLHF